MGLVPYDNKLFFLPLSSSEELISSDCLLYSKAITLKDDVKLSDTAVCGSYAYIFHFQFKAINF